ncbi:MAG: TetR/AcrR family transcriptional regulator [Lachnospiraceae bacterium]|jgi:AcrR family transcriptional regulator|nr:TetR/AcrR family transcriptional regulator [Lachnospiraceae bacterium]SEI55642.1 transcriptional regulator, TetR family [Lachnospiraceae bacterium A10]
MNRNNLAIKTKIIEAAFKVSESKGPKFTMNDLAKELGMSKKTIYTVFEDKESLFNAMVDYFFDSVKAGENQLLKKEADLPIDVRFKHILGVLPEISLDVNYTELYTVRTKYPKVYDRIQSRLESGWELTLSLLDEGMETGVFRPVDKLMFQLTFEAAIERFLMGDELAKSQLNYGQVLTELVDMMVDGIKVQK